VNRSRLTLLLMAVVPLLLVTVAVAALVTQRSRVHAELNLAAVEPVLLAARRAELQGQINLARSAIAHLVRDGMADAARQAEALQILSRLEFGHDGYFFVFDFEGRVLLYPRRHHLLGQNLFDLRDRQGRFPVRELIAQARAGGGYVPIEWGRPSTGQVEQKLAYVEPVAGWEWVLGTGTYVDEPERARRRVAEATEAAVADTLWRVGAVAVLCTMGVVAVTMLINLGEQRRADAKLRAMARQIVLSQEDERWRVARELHDGVSQSLVSAKYQLESALERGDSAGPGDGRDAMRDGLDTGVQRLREVLGDLRRIAHGLRPALLDDLGLAPALEHLGREWAVHSGVRLTVHCEQPPSEPPQAVAIALFRVAQEALGNIAAHAQATHATLRLARVGTGLLLVVEDDGRGFDAERIARSPRRGLGLTHMRERIESLGGRFTLSSGVRGTRVQAAFGPEALS
jgi:two-component system NarL family sensor kinase